MGYCVQTDETLKRGIHRAISEELESALTELNNQQLDQAFTIHEVRKHCKRIRAALHLLKADLNQQYRTEDQRYRNAAREIATNRDAQAMLETYHDLLTRFDSEISAETAIPIYDVLTTQKSIVSDSNEATALGKFTEVIKASYSQISLLPITFHCDTSVIRGVSRSYAKARRCMKQAHHNHDPELYHEWRKWVKYHGYHLQLLRKVLPEANRARRGVTKELGELLGDHHNLFMLRSYLHDNPDLNQHKKARKAFIKVIDHRVKQIEKISRRLGEELFGRKPSKQAWHFNQA